MTHACTHIHTHHRIPSISFIAYPTHTRQAIISTVPGLDSATVVVYGSSATGLATRSSDLDLCLTNVDMAYWADFAKHNPPPPPPPQQQQYHHQQQQQPATKTTVMSERRAWKDEHSEAIHNRVGPLVEGFSALHFDAGQVFSMFLTEHARHLDLLERTGCQLSRAWLVANRGLIPGADIDFGHRGLFTDQFVQQSYSICTRNCRIEGKPPALVDIALRYFAPNRPPHTISSYVIHANITTATTAISNMYLPAQLISAQRNTYKALYGLDSYCVKKLAEALGTSTEARRGLAARAATSKATARTAVVPLLPRTSEEKEDDIMCRYFPQAQLALLKAIYTLEKSRLPHRQTDEDMLLLKYRFTQRLYLFKKATAAVSSCAALASEAVAAAATTTTTACPRIITAAVQAAGLSTVATALHAGTAMAATPLDTPAALVAVDRATFSAASAWSEAIIAIALARQSGQQGALGAAFAALRAAASAASAAAATAAFWTANSWTTPVPVVCFLYMCVYVCMFIYIYI